MPARPETDLRPWFMGPLPGFVLVVGSLVMLLQDGIQPYRILWRQYRWTKVPAARASVEIPYRRVKMKPAVGQRDPAFERGKRSRLSVEHEAQTRSRPSGPSAQTAPTRSGSDGSRVVKKKVLPRQVHFKYVKKGWLFPYKAKIWYVTLAYSYEYKGKVYTILDDTPPFDFENEQQAVHFIQKRTRQWPIKVWVNPDRPNKATAFLIYRNWLLIRLGLAALLGGLIWIALAFAAGRKSSSKTKEDRAADEKAGPARPRHGGGVSDPRGRSNP